MINNISDTKVSFKNINFINNVAKNRIRPNTLLNNEFSRRELINNNCAKILNGPFGHPYTGRPVSNGGDSHTSEQIDDLLNQELADKAENAIEIFKNVFKFVKETIKSILDLD